jgi:hypothetical protein
MKKRYFLKYILEYEYESFSQVITNFDPQITKTPLHTVMIGNRMQ